MTPEVFNEQLKALLEEAKTSGLCVEWVFAGALVNTETDEITLHGLYTGSHYKMGGAIDAMRRSVDANYAQSFSTKKEEE